MPDSCFVNGCSNRRGSTKTPKSYYSFPAVIVNQGDETKELSIRRRREWIANVNRKKNPTKHSRICSDHFIKGKPAYLHDSNNPDWAPTLLLSQKRRDLSSCVQKTAEKNARYERVKERKSQKKKIEVAEALLLLAQTDSKPDEEEEAATDVENDLNSKMRDDYQTLLTENIMLKEKLQALEMRPETFERDDAKVKFLTGLPNFFTLMTVFEIVVKPFLPKSFKSRSALPDFTRFILVMMKLRLGSSNQDLAYRFGVCASVVSRSVRMILHIMYVRLKPLIFWPNREELRLTMPLSFRESFGCKVATIIDCFELFVERPSNLKARAQAYSHYKNNSTVKYLIGITPQGVISFLSQGYGGRTSDKYIAENSGFLEKLLPGDLVLADRGFNISASVGLMCAEVKIPSFTKGKKQLSAFEVESTRKIAHSRVHVERLIGLARNKYTILKEKLPIDYLNREKDGIPTVDKFVTVACALTNMCSSIVPLE